MNYETLWNDSRRVPNAWLNAWEQDLTDAIRIEEWEVVRHVLRQIKRAQRYGD